MPFCTQCGTAVDNTAAFCAQCGARQQGAAAPKTKSALDTMTTRTASILCYLPGLGWIMALVVLAAERFQNERQARFHAFQGLYLFVAWLIVDWGMDPFFHWFPARVLGFGVVKLFKVVILGAWIFMLIKTSQNEHYRLPLLGELADRSLAEQH